MAKSLDKLKKIRSTTLSLDKVPKRKKRLTEADIEELQLKKIAERKKLERKEAPKRRKLVAEVGTGIAVRKISKLDNADMRSIVGDAAEEIQQLLEANNTDSATILMQKKLLQTLTDLIPLAENAVRKSEGGRGVYQINSLITSIREILSDVQASKDRGAMGHTLVETIIRPTFLDLGMLLVQEDARQATTLRDLLEPKTYARVRKLQEDSLKTIAAHIQAKYGESKDKVIQFMQL
jgi:hypothetical protein